MTLQRTIIFTAGAFIALGFAESQAGPPPPCEIEINALRGGSPTVTVGVQKKITAKARIVKGSVPRGTTVDTTLRIDVFDGPDLPDYIHEQKTSPIKLEIGKGGTGATLLMDIPQCIFGPIEFRATFFPNDPTECVPATKSIFKTCK
jgi:hypothetical protein